MANFFLRGIDEAVVREARAKCVADKRRLVDLIMDLLREWLKGEQ